MSGVMDLNHILCEPMETKPTNPTILMHSMEYDDGHYQQARQRVHSEHYRTSPVLSWGYHYYQRDEVLIPPLTSSLSTNMIPSHSSSTMSSLSPSTSSSASSLSSSSSSPITPTLATPSLRHRSASTSQVYQRTEIQTRTPWTPLEDNLLQKGYEQGLSWAMISSTYLPHRSRGCCWGRFKTLQNKNLIDVKTRSSKLSWKTMKISTSSASF